MQVSCWIDNIDRNKIPYIKEDDWRYSYPSLTPLNITKEEKENLFDISNVLFWAMHKTVKSVRHVNDLFGNLSFIGSKFDCISNLSRIDFVKDMNGDFRLIEINSDTPCAIPETFYGNFRFKSKEISLKEKEINKQLAEIFINLCSNDDVIAFASDPNYKEDWYNTKYLYDNFMEHKPQNVYAILIPLSELEVFDDGVYVKNTDQKINILYRLYPTELLIKDKSNDGYPIGMKMIELHNEGKIYLVNPPEALIMQDKRIPAMLHYLNDKYCFYSKRESNYIKKYVPFSGLSFEGILNVSSADKIIKKPIYGREGSGITIYDRNKNIIEQSTVFNENNENVQYIYEEYIEQTKSSIMTAENIKLNGYITYSVFLLNGEAVGLYGRFDVNKICGVEALWLPICMTDTKGTITSIKNEFNFK